MTWLQRTVLLQAEGGLLALHDRSTGMIGS
jgi:hypothetical protein